MMLTVSEMRTSDGDIHSEVDLREDVSSGDIAHGNAVHPKRATRHKETLCRRVHFWDSASADVVKTRSATDPRVAPVDSGLIRERLFFDGATEAPAFLSACKRSPYYCRVKEDLPLDGLMLLVLAGDVHRSDRLFGNIKKTLNTKALNHLRLVVVVDENAPLQQRLEKLRASLLSDFDRLIVRGVCSPGTLGRLMKTSGLIASKATSNAIGKLCVVAKPVIVYEKKGAVERDNRDFMVKRQLAVDGTAQFVATLLRLVVEQPMLQCYISESLKNQRLSHKAPPTTQGSGEMTLNRHGRRHSAHRIELTGSHASAEKPTIVISQS